MSRETRFAAPSIYILDTCAYFRLARSVRPLLGRAFGEPPHYKIFVIKRLVTEHLGSPRLRSKFHWISENEIQNEIASGTYMPKGRKKSTVDEAMSFLRNYVDDVYVAEAKPGPSPADLEALAVAFAIPGFVVSDDKNLRETGKVFDIKTISTFDLLEILLADEIVTVEKIESIIEYWEYDKDLPMASPKLRERLDALKAARGLT